ncbi:unnamed protein product, partial [Ectocarpus fasciculatus]
AAVPAAGHQHRRRRRGISPFLSQRPFRRRTAERRRTPWTGLLPQVWSLGRDRRQRVPRARDPALLPQDIRARGGRASRRRGTPVGLRGDGQAGQRSRRRDGGSGRRSAPRRQDRGRRRLRFHQGGQRGHVSTNQKPHHHE